MRSFNFGVIEHYAQMLQADIILMIGNATSAKDDVIRPIRTVTQIKRKNRAKALFDQPFSMNKSIVKGLLSALKRIQDEQGNACTTIFRKCCDSYLNHYGAVSILDTLTSGEIEEISYFYMKRATE